MTVKIGGPTRSRARAVDTVALGRAPRAVSDRSAPAAATRAGHRLRHGRDAAGFSVAVETHLHRAAPLDLAKVHAVRSAILEGSYRIDPRRIAHRLIEGERGVRR